MGCHLGQHRKRWNPLLVPLIFFQRHDVHILNLRLLFFWLREFFVLTSFILQGRGQILLCSETPQFDKLFSAVAHKLFYFVGFHYLPGLLTNFRQNVGYLKRVSLLSFFGDRKEKKFKLQLSGLLLDKPFQMPSLVFSLTNNSLVSGECIILGIPSFSLVDSDGYRYCYDIIIPCNIRSMQALLFFSALCRENFLFFDLLDRFFFKNKVKTISSTQ